MLPTRPPTATATRHACADCHARPDPGLFAALTARRSECIATSGDQAARGRPADLYGQGRFRRYCFHDDAIAFVYVDCRMGVCRGRAVPHFFRRRDEHADLPILERSAGRARTSITTTMAHAHTVRHDRHAARVDRLFWTRARAERADSDRRARQAGGCGLGRATGVVGHCPVRPTRSAPQGSDARRRLALASQRQQRLLAQNPRDVVATQTRCRNSAIVPEKQAPHQPRRIAHDDPGDDGRHCVGARHGLDDGTERRAVSRRKRSRTG